MSPQSTMTRWLAWCGLLMLLLFALLMHAAQAAPGVHVLTTSPVPAGKFEPLREMARQHGMTLEARYIEKLSAQELDAFATKTDLLIVDAPRDHIVTAMLGQLGPLWTNSNTPRVLLSTDRAEAHGIDAKLATRLQAYYANGGRANFDAMMRTLAADHFHLRDDRSIPAPVVFPKAA